MYRQVQVKIAAAYACGIRSQRLSVQFRRYVEGRLLPVEFSTTVPLSLLSTSALILVQFAAHGMTTLPRVEIAVYDLLPASRLSLSLWYLGCGLYHTSIRLPDLRIELAYGGLLPTLDSSSDDVRRRQQMTGIFSLPSPDDSASVERLMPGLRFIKRFDVGPVSQETLAARLKGSIYGESCTFLGGKCICADFAQRQTPARATGPG